MAIMGVRVPTRPLCPALSRPYPAQARREVVNVGVGANLGGTCVIETGMHVSDFLIDAVQPGAMPEAMVGVRAPARNRGRARTPRITWTMARMLRKSFRNLDGTGVGQARQ